MTETESTGLLPVGSPPHHTIRLPSPPVAKAYGAISSVKEEGGNCVPFRKQHRRDISGESGFETDITRQSSVFSSLEDLHQETEDEELFGYMERQTSHVEDELSKVAEGSWRREETMDLTSTVLSINTEEKDYENISICSQYISVQEERKLYQSAFGILYNLKREICRLINYLELECAKLDRLMVGENMSSNEDGRKLSENYASRRNGFKDRLDKCLEEVGQHMSELRNREDVIVDGVRYRLPESPINKEVRKMPIDCMTWCHIFLFLVMVGLICYMYLWSNSSVEWTVYLRLMRAPILVVFLLYLYGFNMKVWALFKVDYVTIFSHPPLATPTPKYIFRVASFLTVAMAVCVISVIVTTPYEAKLPIKIIPLVMWLILLGFIFNPFDVFGRQIRYNFLLRAVHVMLSPLVFVYFSDFFLADQFNSSVAIFLDMQYLICYLTTDSWIGGKVDPVACTSSGNGIRPIISVLPAFWRILQCLRCFYDTRKFKHLVNMMKYFTTFPVVILSTIFATKIKVRGNLKENFSLEETKVIFSLWLVSLLVNGVYTFIWDVSCDWGLWTGCSILKRKLVYRAKIVYVLAMILDLILRFFWTLKLTLAIVWEKDSDLIFTGLVIAELLRRFIWNFFRVEHAHVLSVKKEDSLCQEGR